MTIRTRILTTLALALALCIVGTSLSYLAYGQKVEHPGAVPYTPSRIEWLALKLQANYRDARLTASGFKIDYVATEQETITIVVHHRSDVNRKAMNESVETARRIIGIETRRYGWDWVQVKELYEKN